MLVILNDIKSTMQETLDAQHESLTELLEFVIERIKQEKENEREALEKQSDIYAKLIEQMFILFIGKRLGEFFLLLFESPLL